MTWASLINLIVSLIKKQHAMRSIYIIYFSSVISIFSLLSCRGQQVATTQTEKALPEWLALRINDFEESGFDTKGQVDEYTYKNETVYKVDFCKNCPDNLIQVFNVNGDVLCEFGGIAGTNSCPDFDNSAKFEKTVWSQ